MEKQVIDNILSICSTFIAAILGVAYPIILNTISRIGEKYSSEYLPVLFKDEYLQRELLITPKFLGSKKSSIFEIILYITLLLLLFSIFDDNRILSPFLLLSTTSLVLVFIFWFKKLALYSGNIRDLVKYLIKKYNSVKDSSFEKKTYILKALNDITLYAVKIGDEHIQISLFHFYIEIIDEIRHKHNKTEPLEYPEFWYSLVNNICKVAVKSSEELGCLDRLATKGYLLLVDHKDNIIISNETYKALWKNVQIICKNPRLIRQFWAHSSEYFEFGLKCIIHDLKFGKRSEENQKQMERREEEELLFLEFHNALGGLLLYSKQYNSLNYIIHYSHSYPPKHILPPTSLFRTLQLISHFTENNRQIHSVAFTYTFTDLDNYGNNLQIVDWICRYIAIAFLEYEIDEIRNYTYNFHFNYFPKKINILLNCLDSIEYLRKSITFVINNNDWLKDSNINIIDKSDSDKITIYINKLKYHIKSKIDYLRLNTTLSPILIKKYYSESNRIIIAAFDRFIGLFNNNSSANIDVYDIENIQGFKAITSKALFIEDDTIVEGADTFLANHIMWGKIYQPIMNSLFSSQTIRYVLNIDNILNALEVIINNNKDVVIACIDLDYEALCIINSSKFRENLLSIEVYGDFESTSLFILRRSDLPVIEHCDLPEETIKELQLKCINPKLKLYASVIDINTEENKELKKKWNIENDDNPQVQLAIQFLAKLYWKKNREVIQIDVASQYKEQGILNSVSDVKPLSKLPQ